MRTRLTIFALLCAGFVGASLIAWASDKQQPTPSHTLELSTLMRAKLASSQKITEGLVVKDFDLIRKGAEELREVTAATQWYSPNDPVFVQHRSELSRQAEKLVRAAEEKNLDAAAYTYVRSLTTCIGCHEYCRDVLHVPAMRRNLNAVVPIPVSDDDPSGSTQPAAAAR
jgi:hypothetical protein